MKKLIAIISISILFQAAAGAVDLTFLDAGCYYQTGGRPFPPVGNNYMVGDNGGDMIYRNWFVFDLSGIDMTIKSATLRAYNLPDGYESPDPTETWELFDVSTDITSLRNYTGGVSAFNDLGSGLSYGSVTVSVADNNSFVEVNLNSNALAAMNSASGLFAIGGALTTLTPGTDEYVFGMSRTNPQAELVLEVVPEPATIGLLSLGSIVLLRRKRNERVNINSQEEN